MTLPPTLISAPDDESGSAQLSLLVIADEGVTRYPLPTEGVVSIGRANECTIRVDDPSISREHAHLHVGASLRLVDLGSANGSRVSGVQLAPNTPVEVEVGEVFELGSSLVVTQRVSPSSTKNRLFTHTFFELHLEQACAQARTSKRQHLAVVRVRIDGALPAHAVRTAYSEALLPGEIVAQYAPGDYELFVPDTSGDRPAELVEILIERLEAAGARVSTAVATFPTDGRTAEALIETAGAKVRGAEDLDMPPERIVEDPTMVDIYRLIQRIARGNLGVLLLGETGVGKEVLADAVHESSRRRAFPFVRINCAALSESLLESELFGHEKGAFTGAATTKRGLLEVASGGTVFLDELGEMPLTLQAKLLRAIEQQQIMRVGGVDPVDIDIRFVSATNRDLESEIEAGRFRADLYYRLNGVAIVVPPLRDRRCEIPLFVRTFVSRTCQELDHPTLVISDRALSLMMRYDWPGNIRELRNVVERAVLLCTQDTIEPEHLPLDKLTTSWGTTSEPSSVALSPQDQERRNQIIAALEQCGGNQTKAATLLGVSRRTLSTWLDKYDVPRPRKG